MKKSLFRFTDIAEFCIAYVFCFSLNILFESVKLLNLKSYILTSFFQTFTEHRLLIVFLFTFIVAALHYQLLRRKKTEIYCKVLVGDTILHITIRYMLDCLAALGSVFLLSVLVSLRLKLHPFGSFPLVLIFFFYILISGSQVRNYENF